MSDESTTQDKNLDNEDAEEVIPTREHCLSAPSTSSGWSTDAHTENEVLHSQPSDSPVKNVPNLLPEIMGCIIRYLKIHELRSARLTCKQWNEHCTKVQICRKIKFVFRHNISTEEMADIVLNSDLAVLNLDFQAHYFYSLKISDIWETRSQRIRSLKFPAHRRENTGTLFRIIIFRCAQLTSIHLDGTGWYVEPVLDQLIDNGFTHPQLRSFRCDHMTPKLFEKMLVVFPGLNFMSNIRCSLEENRLRSSLLQKLSSVGLYLDDTVIIDLEPDAKGSNPVCESRLTEFRAEVNCVQKFNHTIFDFITRLKDLKIIALYLKCAEEESLRKLIFHIMNNCPSLCEFHIENEEEPDSLFYFFVTFRDEDLKRFWTFISKLKYCRIDCHFFLSSFPKIPSSGYYPFLNALSLNNRIDDQSTLLHILEHCSRLQHLEIFKPTDEVLQEIFRTTPDLRTLLLRNVYCSCTNYGFTGQAEGEHFGLSIRRLHRLEYLLIDDKIYQYSEPEQLNFLEEFFFVHLKHLILINLSTELVCMPLEFTALCKAVSSMPYLETLALPTGYTRDSMKELFAVCKPLKRLFHLQIHFWDGTRETIEDIRPLFEAISSLRLVSVKYDDSYNLYSFNPFSREIAFEYFGKDLPEPENIFTSGWNQFFS